MKFLFLTLFIIISSCFFGCSVRTPKSNCADDHLLNPTSIENFDSIIDVCDAFTNIYNLNGYIFDSDVKSIALNQTPISSSCSKCTFNNIFKNTGVKFIIIGKVLYACNSDSWDNTITYNSQTPIEKEYSDLFLASSNVCGGDMDILSICKCVNIFTLNEIVFDNPDLLVTHGNLKKITVNLRVNSNLDVIKIIAYLGNHKYTVIKNHVVFLKNN